MSQGVAIEAFFDRFIAECLEHPEIISRIRVMGVTGNGLVVTVCEPSNGYFKICRGGDESLVIIELAPSFLDPSFVPSLAEVKTKALYRNGAAIITTHNGELFLSRYSQLDDNKSEHLGDFPSGVARLGFQPVVLWRQPMKVGGAA